MNVKMTSITWAVTGRLPEAGFKQEYRIQVRNRHNKLEVQEFRTYNRLRYIRGDILIKNEDNNRNTIIVGVSLNYL